MMVRRTTTETTLEAHLGVAVPKQSLLVLMNTKPKTNKVLMQTVCVCVCVGESYCIVFPLVEADVSVEDFDEELHLQ